MSADLGEWAFGSPTPITFSVMKLEVPKLPPTRILRSVVLLQFQKHLYQGVHDSMPSPTT